MDANGNRGGAPNVVVVIVDGWPTDRVEEASRLARESGINIFFVTIEAAAESEKQNIIEPNFVDKVLTGLGSGQELGSDCIFQAVSIQGTSLSFLPLMVISCPAYTVLRSPVQRARQQCWSERG